MKNVIVICGPTASGKTALGVALAKELNGEVISADSMQIYRDMDIGTAKPTPAEMEGIPHYMLDVVDPEEDYSAARYVADASQAVDQVLGRGKLPLIVGGTGLYIDNLLAGRSFAAFTGQYRAELERRAETEGLAALYEELGRVDKPRQQELHPGDKKRIIRALEVFRETGEPMSVFNERTRSIPPRYHALRIGLAFADRRDMWEQIDRRVDGMMDRGLPEEVRGLLDRGVPRSATSMQAIGYKELADALLTGGSLREAAEVVKLRSRQYGKRQLSWFRRWKETRWILWDHTPDFSKAIQDSTNFLSEWGI